MRRWSSARSGRLPPRRDGRQQCADGFGRDAPGVEEALTHAGRIAISQLPCSVHWSRTSMSRLLPRSTTAETIAALRRRFA